MSSRRRQATARSVPTGSPRPTPPRPSRGTGRRTGGPTAERRGCVPVASARPSRPPSAAADCSEVGPSASRWHTVTAARRHPAPRSRGDFGVRAPSSMMDPGGLRPADSIDRPADSTPAHHQPHRHQEQTNGQSAVDDVTIRADEFDAVIFDLDGVITKTAAVHEVAWAEMFDRYLRDRAEATGARFEPFTSVDYGEYVDGKPRYDGVQSFLEFAWDRAAMGRADRSARGRDGLRARATARTPSSPESSTERGVEPYPSSVRFIRGAARSRSPHGALLVEPQRQCRCSTRRASAICSRCASKVELTAELGLPGKPDPAVLIEATRRIGATPERTAVVEDAISGVEAGRRGGFALVIGLDRIGPGRRPRCFGRRCRRPRPRRRHGRPGVTSETSPPCRRHVPTSCGQRSVTCNPPCSSTTTAR